MTNPLMPSDCPSELASIDDDDIQNILDTLTATIADLPEYDYDDSPSVSKSTLKNDFNDHINGNYPIVKIEGVYFNPSRILSELDEISYNQSFNAFIEGDYVQHEGDYYLIRNLATYYLDVRLNLFEGSLALLTGDSQYDTDHRGFWCYDQVEKDNDPEDVLEGLLEKLAASIF